jgi:hypothetical protein
MSFDPTSYETRGLNNEFKTAHHLTLNHTLQILIIRCWRFALISFFYHQPGLLSSLIGSLWPKSLLHLNLFQTPCPGFNNPNHICWLPQIMRLLTVQFSPSPVTTALSGTNILSTLFANTVKLWLSLGAEVVFTPYKQRVMYSDVCVSNYETWRKMTRKLTATSVPKLILLLPSSRNFILCFTSHIS